MTPVDYIGKHIEYPGKKRVKISTIVQASGYPEHFPLYYEIYYMEHGIEIWYINLPEDDFSDSNSIFCAG